MTVEMSDMVAYLAYGQIATGLLLLAGNWSDNVLSRRCTMQILRRTSEAA